MVPNGGPVPGRHLRSTQHAGVGELRDCRASCAKHSGIVDAYSLGGNVAPDWGNAELFTGYAGPDDFVMPQLKTWAARRGKEEVELFNARSKMRELRRGAVVNEEAAAAAADGSLPAGATPKPRAPRKRGKALEPPAQSA